MKRIFLLSFLFLPVIALVATGFTSRDGGAPYLFLKTDKRGTAKSDRDPSLIQGIHVLADLALLADAKAQRVRVPLPGGREVVLRKQRFEKRDGVQTWYGDAEEKGRSFAFFTSTGKALNGRIELGEKLYRVVYMGNGVHHIGELDRKKLDEVEDDGEVPKYGKPRDRKEEDGCPDPASDIDVMVAYTQDAEDGAGGPEGMEALIHESIQLTNLAYENSDIAQRMRLVHTTKVDYTESSNSTTHRADLQGTADGEMDGIHALRDAHGADIVLLITETSEAGNCGRAYIMDPVSDAHADWAFGVVKRECSADNLSFPHEVAHIMSARHQDDGNVTPFAYAHGHFVTAPSDGSGMGWETIMSKRGDCARQIFFSNPDLSFSPTGSATTDPMGTAADRDNSRVLDQTAATVANFRCSSPNVSDVWMKDRWEDTGLEPDPATAGMAMYVSPYIWIRNAQDPTFLFQHDHDDPRFGQDNWIYVKLHNGSMAAQNGNLEIYVADASASLVWPSGWSLVASVPVNLAASSSHIVEQVWNTVPDPATGSSHYCMIARWNSASDPMTTPEGSDIGANVRANNNIVWRNLNIVALDDDGDSHVALNVAGNRKSKLARLSFTDETLFPRPKFTSNGQVYVSIDEKLWGFWKAGGSITSGLQHVNGTTFALTSSNAWLDRIPLPHDYQGIIKVYFKKSDQTVPGKYRFAVRHHKMDSGVPELLGGVDYDLIKK